MNRRARLRSAGRRLSAIKKNARFGRHERAGLALLFQQKYSPATGAGDTATDTPPSAGLEQSVEVIEKIGGDDGDRTRDLRRDRPAF